MTECCEIHATYVKILPPDIEIIDRTVEQTVSSDNK